MYSNSMNSRFLLLAILGIYLLACALQSQVLLNWDVSWLMRASEKLLKGGSYSNDFFELNPPLILYLYAPAVLVMRFFSLNIAIALKLYVFLLASISLFMCYRLTQKNFLASDSKIAQLFFLTIACILLVIPLQEFGQREHLLILFSLPYLLLVGARLQDQRVQTALAISIGVFAWLGLALKPYFLLVPALVELYAMFYKRRFFFWKRAEIFAIVVLLFVYVAAIFIFHPDYIRKVIPLTRLLYYTAYKAPWQSMLGNGLIFFSLTSLVLYCAAYNIKQYRPLASVLAMAVMGLILSFLIQQTNWYYHASPAYQMAVLLDVLLIGRLVTEKNIILLTLICCCSLFVLTYAPAPATHWYETLRATMVFFPGRFFCFFGIIFGALLYVAQLSPQKSDKVFWATLFILSLGFLFTSITQHIDWYMHRLLLTTIFLLLLLSLWLPSNPVTKYRYLLIALLAIRLLSIPFLNTHLIYNVVATKKQDLSDLIAFMQTHTAHQSVYYFANSAQNLLPALDVSDSETAMRTEDCGWVPSILIRQHDDAAQLNAIKNQYVNMIADDLNKKTPRYIFIDANKNHVPKHIINFDYITYFSDNPNFRDAWKKYHYVGTLEKPMAYNFLVYERS